MDTKLKRYDRVRVTKAICFILAIVFTVIGSAKAFAYLEYLSNEELPKSYVENLLYQFDDFDIEKSVPFADEYRNFLTLVYNKAVIYGDGTQADYEKHKERLDKLLNERVEDEIKNYDSHFLRNGYYTAYNLIQLYDNGEISLEKIADIEDSSVTIPAVYYNGNYYLDSESFSDFYYNEYGDDEEYYDEEYDESETAVYTTFHDLDESSVLQEKVQEDCDKMLSQKITDKAGDCYAIAVFLGENTENGKHLSGYYKVKLNQSALAAEVLSESGLLIGRETSTTYSQFRENAEKNEKLLSEYKNMYYALCRNGGKVVSNVKDLNGKTESEAKKKLLSYSFSRYDDFAEADGVSGEDYAYYDRAGWTDGYFGNTSEYFDENWKNACDILGEKYTLTVAFDDRMPYIDVFMQISSEYEDFCARTEKALAVVALCLLMLIACIVVLIIKSGRKSADIEVHMLPLDRIFTFLRTAMSAAALFALGYAAAALFVLGAVEHAVSSSLCRVGTVLLCALIAAALIDLLTFWARHIKNGTLLKNSLIYWLYAKTVKVIRRKIAEKKEERSKVYKDIFNDVFKKIILFVFAPNLIVGLLVVIFALDDSWGACFLFGFPLFLYDIFVLIYILRYAYQLRSVLYNLNQLSQGNFDLQIDSSKMSASVKKYAEDITSLGDGLKKAVDNAVREEKTKTELITNVSHDLKTPLTSIITYVDLLSRCDIEDETAKGYIQVLGEKSARLKRLIEDLVEASKASTNNIQVNLVKVSLNELAMQIAGEYEDEFASKGLKMIIDGTGTSLTVLADSKLSYRVLDNLMNNIRKYAMPNTRVYFTISQENDMAVITLRNISENQLGIPASELMSRFVRGDASRSTEGSGLGLSIAESFCSLQGGKLSIDISGDLFTARVEFRLA